MARVRALIASAVLATAVSLPPTVARAQEPCPDRAFANSRHQEDMSALAEPRCRTLPLDDLKVVELSEEAVLVLGGEVRSRLDYYSSLDVNRNLPGATFNSHRAYLFGDVRHRSGLRLFAQTRIGREIGFPGPDRPREQGGPDLHELFVELPLGRTARLRLGRQELNYQDDLNSTLFAIADGNLRRNWDAVRLAVDAGDWALNAFVADEVLPDDRFLDRTLSGRTRAVGLRVARPRGRGGFRAYYYGVDRREIRDRRHTAGVEFADLALGGGAQLDLDAAVQFGEAQGTPVRAEFAAFNLSLPLAARTPADRLFVRGDYFSGGHSAGRVHTFDPLFPSAVHVNEAELLRGSNIIVAGVGADRRLRAAVTARVRVDAYWRADRSDGLYTLAGLRVPGTERGRDLWAGFYLGGDLTWRANHYLEVLVSGGRFFLPDHRGGGGVDFLRLQTRARF